jgi:hypothetical protein
MIGCSMCNRPLGLGRWGVLRAFLPNYSNIFDFREFSRVLRQDFDHGTGQRGFWIQK